MQKKYPHTGPAKASPNDIPQETVSAQTLMSVYVTFIVLCRIRHELGLEAMLEYIDRYRSRAEKCAPGVCERIRAYASTVDLSALSM